MTEVLKLSGRATAALLMSMLLVPMPAAAPAASPVPAGAVAVLRACSSTGISTSVIDRFGAAGTGETEFRLHNLSTRPCMLRGYPRVRLLDRRFSLLQTILHRGGIYPLRDRPHTVRLDTGGSAVFWLGDADVQIQRPGWTCRPVPYLMIFLPGDTLPLVSRSGSRGSTLEPCSPILTVSSFQAHR